MYNKRINIWKSVSILILIKKDIWAFSSYSHSLKTANLKHTRISRWKFTLYRAWTIHAYLCARCLAVPQTENRLWMVPPFLLHYDTHRKLIEEELHRQERSVTWFANKLYCDRTNTYKIFKRQSIDTELLLRISQVLHVNFFEYYSRECQNREKQSTLM